MKLEEFLSEQGTDPLTDELNGRPLRAFINANLKRVGSEPIDADTTCDVILERIYGIEDVDVQNTLLNRTVANLKGDSNYKRFSMYGAILLTVIVIGLIVTGGHLSPEVIDALKSIALGIINLIGPNTPPTT
jgi:hypothetical protein